MDNELFELWKPIPGYEGFYEVSTFGRLRSLPRRGTHGKILSDANFRGYRNINLSVSGQAKTHLVHQLVAKTFIANPKYLTYINHIDGNKSNNHISNLEWVSHLENMQHAFSTGLANNSGQNHGMHKLKEKDVLEIRARVNKLVNELADEYKVSRQTIIDIRDYKSWKTLALKKAGEL